MFSSIRVQLTLWYVLIFGLGVTLFSFYLFSELRQTIYREFDDSLLHTAQAAAGYFDEFTERGNPIVGAVETVQDLRLSKAALAILDGDRFLAATSDPIWPSLRALIPPVGSQTPVFQTDPAHRVRMVVIPVAIGTATFRILAVEPLAEVYSQIDGIERSMAVGIPVLLLLALCGGLLLSDRSLKPVNAICLQAEHITAHSLDERLPVVHPRDELGRLSRVINALLARLERSFEVMRSFMQDGSHELRTPLSVIQGEVDVVLSRERTPADYRESLGIIRDQAKRMSRIVNDMLALSRADAGPCRVPVENLYLNDLVEECCRAAQSLAAKKNLRLNVQLEEEDICINGNEELLRRMIGNLVDNAIQYTPDGGSVSVRLEHIIRHTSGQSSGKTRLTVADTGIGIPREMTERVFDRFFRVDPSRNRASGGAGLGLSIVKLAAESHRGSVSLHSEPGRGSTFTVDLPVV